MKKEQKWAWVAGDMIQSKVARFKQSAKGFFLAVVLMGHTCPRCGGQLAISAAGQAVCQRCSHSFDPTLAFQYSSCCGALLSKRVKRYVCTACGQTQISDYLFDERVFDRSYFKERMRIYRQKASEKRKVLIRRMLEARSEQLFILNEPDLEAHPGLAADLDGLGGWQSGDEVVPLNTVQTPGFDLGLYRSHIWDQLGWDEILFSDLAPLTSESRQDRVWSFVALVFMQQRREVSLSQSGPSDLWIKKCDQDEAYAEG